MRDLSFNLLITVLLVIAFLGAIVAAVNYYLDVAPPLKNLIIFIIIICGIAYIGHTVGVF